MSPLGMMGPNNPTASASPAHVASSTNTASATSGSASANVFGSTPASGNLIIIALRDVTATSGLFSSLSGLASSWTSLGSEQAATGLIQFLYGTTNGTNTLTATSPDGAIWRVVGEIFSNAGTPTGFTGNNFNGVTSASVSITPTANQGVFAAISWGTTGSLGTAPASPWTDGVVSSSLQDAWQIVSSGGSVTATWAISIGTGIGGVGAVVIPHL